jgi:Cdc6-like AAA superfamily ATPase
MFHSVHFKDCQVPFLWLHGIPGCGKTILSSSIIEYLRQPQSNTAFPLLYFYFDFNDNRKQTLDGALRSLISQLADQSASASKEAELLHKSNKDGNEQPSTQTLSQTLHKMLTVASHTRIVLDALDECMTRNELLPWI